MALIADLRAKPPPVFGGFGSHQSFTPAEPAVRHVHGEGRPSVPRNKYISIVYSLRAQLRLNVELKMEDILGLFDNLPVVRVFCVFFSVNIFDIKSLRCVISACVLSVIQ